MSNMILYSSVAILVYMGLFFLVAWRKQDNSVVDIAWGGGFIVIALVSFLATPDYTLRSLLVTGLVIVWGLRLSIHLFIRNWGKGEDFRYAQMRKSWGNRALIKSITRVFLLQGVIMLFLAYPIMLVNHSSEQGLRLLDIAGLILWVIGFCFEAVGDYQLLRFKQNRFNRGKVMQTGVWRYTRHPNYFGEATLWWGIWLITLSVQGGWVAVFSPLLLTFLLLRVSGVPMLEARYKNDAVYQAYVQRTNSFVPWFPKTK